MTVFVDTSVWYAAMDSRQHRNADSKAILSGSHQLVTSSFVLLETWFLANSRLHWQAAEDFLTAIQSGLAALEIVIPADLVAAQHIGLRYADQKFSLADRTSFAVMERLGIKTAASFDSDFAIYRYGRKGSEAFEVLR